MVRARALLGTGFVVLFGAGIALAQSPVPDSPVTVEGRAYGSRATLLGSDVDLLTTSDTGEQGATAPGTFDETAPAQPVAEVPGVLRVVTSSDSRTFGEALPGASAEGPDERCASAVVSTAGLDPSGSGECSEASATRNAVVDVLPGEPSLVRAVTTCSQASISGNAGPEGRSFLSALEVNGTALPVTFDTETVVVSEALPLIRINHQTVETSLDAATGLGTASIRQEALRVQALDDAGDLAQVILSSSSGRLSDLPQECPIFRCPLPQIEPNARFAVDGGCPASPDEGDEIDFTIGVTNAGQGDASVRLVSRVPANVSASSIVVPDDATATHGGCPDDVAFAGCPDEEPVDTARECITVEVASLPAGESRSLAFRGTVTADGSVCSTSVAELAPLDPRCDRPAISREVALVIPELDCEPPTPTPTATPTPTDRRNPTVAPTDPPRRPSRPRATATPAPTATPGSDRPGLGGNEPLGTTGGGGCAISPEAATFDVWPFLFLAFLAARRRRR